MFDMLRHFNKRPTFVSQKTKMEYDEFKGGFCWPADGHEGYIVVIGLETTSRKLRVVHECHERSFTAFASSLRAAQECYHFSAWYAPTEDNESLSYYDTALNVCRQEGFTLACLGSTMTHDLQLSAHVVGRESSRGMLLMPAEGPLHRNLNNLHVPDLTDQAKDMKYLPIVVAAQVVHAFPHIEDRTLGVPNREPARIIAYITGKTKSPPWAQTPGGCGRYVHFGDDDK